MITINPIRASQIRPCFKANPMPEIEAEHINKKFESAKSIDIFCHVSTDEDSFSSAKAMYLYLKDMGKDVRIICSDKKSLYGYEKDNLTIIPFNQVNDKIKHADLALCIDFSDKSRLDKNVTGYFKTFASKDIVGFDHHQKGSILSPSQMAIISESYKSVSEMPVTRRKNFYVDTTAKSCSAIIYRFFEAMGFKPGEEHLASMFCGMCDDMKKSGLIKFIKDFKILFSNFYNPQQNKNTREVYNKVAAELDDKRKEEIIKHIDVISYLTPEEINFERKLFRNVQTSDNGEFAYYVIPTDDEEWAKLGGDTKRTSSIIRDFRTRLLENASSDKLISKNLHTQLKKVKVAAVFYPNTKENMYRVSLHSAEGTDYVGQYTDYINTKYLDYYRQKYNTDDKDITGGHAERSGGKIHSLEKENCEEFIGWFLEAADNIQLD